MLQEFCVLRRSDPFLSIEIVFLDFFNVIGVPWSPWVFDVKALAAQSLHLLYFLGRRHWRLQLLVWSELVRLEMLLHQKGRAIYNLQIATRSLNSINRFS